MPLSLDRIVVIVRKEFRQMLRHRRQRVALFAQPVMQLLIFGYAVNLDIEHIRIGWMDGDRTAASQDLLSSFTGSSRFTIAAEPRSSEEVQWLLDAGKVDAVITVMPGFARDLARGRTATAQILIDGSNSNSAALISSYATQVVSGFSTRVAFHQQMLHRLALAESGEGGSLKAPQLGSEARVWFNPDLKSRNFFIPGLVSNILLIVTVMLTAMSIVREKETGTMEQLLVTPVRPIELIAGKIAPPALVGLIDVLLITGASTLFFGTPFRGSLLLLLGCAALFLLTGLGTGLLISAISSTQQQAMMSAFLFAGPAYMLSGFIFPIRNMPEIIQYLTYLNPLRYFIEIVRGIMLKGVGIEILWPQLLPLAVYGCVMMFLSASRFRSRLE